MAPSGLFLQKDDFYRDSIRDSQSGATGYSWSLQDLAALLEKLQIQGPRPHRLQQPPSIHGYEEFELQTGLVGPRTLLIPLSHKLLIGESKWSCRRSILLPPEVNRWGSRSESWKLLDSSSVTKFTDQNQPNKALLFQPQSKANKQLFFFPQGIHLWDSRLPVAVSVLRRTLGRASQREALQDQHWWDAVEANQIAGQWTQSQRLLIKKWPGRRLRRRWHSLLPPVSPICSRNHPNKADQSPSRWFTSYAFRNRENTRVGCAKILLANPLPWRRDIRERLWRVFSLENGAIQTLLRPAVFSGPYE